VLRLTTTFLAEHGSESARLDGELLIAHALGVERIDLYLQFDRSLGEPLLASIRDLVRRRARGEPVAYITGVREFYSRTFEVTPDVLIPRPETETLVDAVLARAEGAPAGDLADLGTGSGCIAVTLAAELPGRDVVATDLSGAALEVAAANAERHGVAERVRFLQGDWAAALDGPVAVVVSNPPYITAAELAELPRDVSAFEPRLALDCGSDGLDAYRRLLASLGSRLLPTGLLALEVDPRRAEAVAGLVEERLPSARSEVIVDLARRPRVVIARRDCPNR
jgi:release factor glutamine methyltransferase